MRGHSLVWLGVLVALLALAVIAGIRVGAVDLAVMDIVTALSGRGDPTTRTIVWGLRLPRIVLAALCGAALARSGMTYQALLRNPLADPYILGVSSGAAVGAVAAVVLGGASSAVWVLPAAAFAGSLVAIMLALRVALVGGVTLDTRVLLLAGVVVGAFGNAVVLLLLTFADADTFRSAVFWMMGSLAGATWERTLILGAPLVVGATLLGGQARSLDLLAIGEPTAATLGVEVERTKRLCYLLAALLTATAVAVSGVIGFVGLVVPHAVRLMWGSPHRFALPAAGVLGATFLVLSDLLARTVAAPEELPIGVVTALIGVPLFVALLQRRHA